jgi:hypothetical protein
MSPSTDPVLVKRAKVARLVALGSRIGYSLFGIAIVAFAVFMIAKNNSYRFIPTLVAWTMGIGSLFLAPAIVFGYAVKAAERHDRELAAAKKSKDDKRASRQP